MKLLVYTRTTGFRHPSIYMAIPTIQSLAESAGIAVEFTEDPTRFTHTGLAEFDVVAFVNTTGQVLDTAAQRSAFEGFIRNGGGFVGVHSAADTEYDWPFYAELIGAYFMAHPVLDQPGTLLLEDPSHPTLDFLRSDRWPILLEEFYSFRSNPRAKVRVLMRLDESDNILLNPNTSCNPAGPSFPLGYDAYMGDHPMSWCHDNLGGRAWYTALGHGLQMYADSDFRQHLLRGILTAGRRVAADCTPLPAPAQVPAYRPPELRQCYELLLPQLND
jgi:type 1 glutamine amidotransferase